MKRAAEERNANAATVTIVRGNKKSHEILGICGQAALLTCQLSVLEDFHIIMTLPLACLVESQGAASTKLG